VSGSYLHGGVGKGREQNGWSQVEIGFVGSLPSLVNRARGSVGGTEREWPARRNRNERRKNQKWVREGLKGTHRGRKGKKYLRSAPDVKKEKKKRGGLNVVLGVKRRGKI